MTTQFKVFVLALLFLSFLLFFSKEIQSYFSQDDFFHLRVVMDKSLTDIPGFFLSKQTEYAFYRPLSRETFNLITFNIFGFNPLPFHLINSALIFFMVFLVYKISKKLGCSKLALCLILIIFITSSIHSIELYYLASVQTLMAAVFVLLSFYLYLNNLSKPHLKSYFGSLLAFVVALLSHETGIILLGIIICWEIIYQKRIKILLPFLVIGIFYLLQTSLLSSLPNQEVYKPVLSPKVLINTFTWYILWSFGLSEMVIDFIGPGLKINPNLLKWYGSYLQIVFPLLVFIGLSLTFFLITKIRQNFLNKKILGIAVAYLISLSPFLLFPQHKSSYYLSLSTAWLSIFLGQVLAEFWSKRKFHQIWVILFIISWVLISFQTTRLNALTYWAAKRAVAAKFILEDIKNKFPTLEKDQIIYVKNDPNYPFIAKDWGSSSKQAFYILSGSDAFKLLYRNPRLQVFFEDIDKFPEKGKEEKTVNYFAKFPF